MLRIDATNLPSPRRVARSRQLAPVPGPLPPPPRLPRDVLPPELAAQPVTGNTMSPTAMDAAAPPAAPPTKTRRSLELVSVAVAAFALSWVCRGSLQGAS